MEEIIEFGLEGTFKNHLVQTPCHGQGHLLLDQVVQSPIHPNLEHWQRREQNCLILKEHTDKPMVGKKDKERIDGLGQMGGVSKQGENWVRENLRDSAKHLRSRSWKSPCLRACIRKCSNILQSYSTFKALQVLHKYKLSNSTHKSEA